MYCDNLDTVSRVLIPQSCVALILNDTARSGAIKAAWYLSFKCVFLQMCLAPFFAVPIFQMCLAPFFAPFFGRHLSLHAGASHSIEFSSRRLMMTVTKNRRARTRMMVNFRGQVMVRFTLHRYLKLSRWYPTRPRNKNQNKDVLQMRFVRLDQPRKVLQKNSCGTYFGTYFGCSGEAHRPSTRASDATEIDSMFIDQFGDNTCQRTVIGGYRCRLINPCGT